MGFPRRRSWALGLAVCALSFGGSSLAAQQPAPATLPGAKPAPATASADPELTSFAKAFVALGLVRDDFDARLALTKNKTVELQTQLRQEMKAKIEEVIRATGLSLDAYRRIEYSITVDQARRAAFDQVLAAANAG